MDWTRRPAATLGAGLCNYVMLLVQNLFPPYSPPLPWHPLHTIRSIPFHPILLLVCLGLGGRDSATAATVRSLARFVRSFLRFVAPVRVRDTACRSISRESTCRMRPSRKALFRDDGNATLPVRESRVEQSRAGHGATAFHPFGNMAGHA